MNITISLTPELLNLMKAKVASGRYTSTSGVVRDALRLLECTNRLEVERVELLRRAWQGGCRERRLPGRSILRQFARPRGESRPQRL